MPWQRGQTGNAGGRPKITLPDGRTLAEVAREHTIAAVETMVTVMSDQQAPPAARVSAASTLLDRGWGRANQVVEFGGLPLEPDYNDPDAARVSIARYIEQQKQRAAEQAA